MKLLSLVLIVFAISCGTKKDSNSSSDPYAQAASEAKDGWSQLKLKSLTEDCAEGGFSKRPEVFDTIKKAVTVCKCFYEGISKIYSYEDLSYLNRDDIFYLYTDIFKPCAEKEGLTWNSQDGIIKK